MKELAIVILKMAVAGFIGGLMAFLVHSYLDMPLVTFAKSTGACLKVEMPDGTLGDCSKLPARYEHDYDYTK